MNFLKQNNFTILIIATACIAFYIPEYFKEIGGYKLSNLIKPCLQVIMLGMGLTMSFSDFKEVFTAPRRVIIGLVCQFTIMPFLGFLMTKVFQFPNEIAAGFILIGCSPSGIASNVMTLIAKGNLPLSITITACATILATFVTPLLMNILAGELMALDFIKMFFDMVQLVVIPILLGLIVNKYFNTIAEFFKPLLPVISKVGIAYIILVVTANGSETIKTAGILFLVAILLHNTMGYLLGYYAARLLNLNETDARTISIEVGMQNGGLATALANEMGKLATLGVAPALFSPVMNITGSMLAGMWGKKSISNQN